MHEWALAEAVVESSLRLSKEKNIEKVNEIYIKVGELQNIDIEVFDYAFKELIKDTLLKNSKIIYETQEAILKCNNCRNEWKFMESFKNLSEDEKEAIHFIPETLHIYIKCPKCGSIDFEIINGRGVFLEDIK
ncbi:MAG: hydrogenase nickel incorporation protein HypA [Caldisericia bacterium]|nr:hydrogenase nickel incorporation protein HypA [Caldisericia bacterium]